MTKRVIKKCIRQKVEIPAIPDYLNDAKRSRQALTLFARLYQIEARAREEKLSFEERLEQRNKHSLEVIHELKKLLESWRMKLLPKFPIAVQPLIP